MVADSVEDSVEVVAGGSSRSGWPKGGSDSEEAQVVRPEDSSDGRIDHGYKPPGSSGSLGHRATSRRCYMKVRKTVIVDAPIGVVWRVFSDIERWADWTESISAIRFVEGAAIVPGARVAIKQPRLPRLVWAVTEATEGRSWTWIAESLGAKTVARHSLSALDDSATRVEQQIEQSGLLGRPVGAILAGLTRRYLTMEGRGLKDRCEAVYSAGDTAS